MVEKIRQIKELIIKAINFLRPGKVRELYFRYEAYFSPLALLTGFVVDSLTLQRIDLWVENVVISSYLLLALLAILFLSAYEVGRFKHAYLLKTAKFVPFVLQFTFGGLFSAFFIFYNRSATIFASWPFLLVILLILIGNEAFRQRYLRLSFRLSIYFMAIFSYAVFVVPIIFSRLGTLMFLISGFVSWIVLAIVIIIVKRIASDLLWQSRISLALSLFSIYLLFNIFYFSNLIPPIPLAVKDSGFYHSVKREGSIYAVSYEESAWYEFWQEYDNSFHLERGQPIYFYTAIFAPTDFNLRILHHWQYYNDDTQAWQSINRLGYNIVGGRDNGYRGYTYKYNVWPGKWRVDTITEQGQIMGRAQIMVYKAENEPVLKNGRK